MVPLPNTASSNDVPVSHGPHTTLWSHRAVTASEVMAMLVYVYALGDVPTVTKPPNHVFLRSHPIAKRCMAIFAPKTSEFISKSLKASVISLR